MPTDRLRRATLVAALLAATVPGVAALDLGHGTDDRSAAVPAAGTDARGYDGAASVGVDARRSEPNLTLTPTPPETPTPTETPTETPASIPARTATATETPTPAGTATRMPTPSPTPTETPTPSPTPNQPAATETPTPAATSDDDGAGESPVLIGVGGLVVVGAAALALREFQR